MAVKFMRPLTVQLSQILYRISKSPFRVGSTHQNVIHALGDRGYIEIKGPRIVVTPLGMRDLARSLSTQDIQFFAWIREAPRTYGEAKCLCLDYLVLRGIVDVETQKNGEKEDSLKVFVTEYGEKFANDIKEGKRW